MIAGGYTVLLYSKFIVYGCIAKVMVESAVAEGRKSKPVALVSDDEGSTGEGEYPCPTADWEKPTVCPGQLTGHPSGRSRKTPHSRNTLP